MRAGAGWHSGGDASWGHFLEPLIPPKSCVPHCPAATLGAWCQGDSSWNSRRQRARLAQASNTPTPHSPGRAGAPASSPQPGCLSRIPTSDDVCPAWAALATCALKLAVLPAAPFHPNFTFLCLPLRSPSPGLGGFVVLTFYKVK